MACRQQHLLLLQLTPLIWLAAAAASGAKSGCPQNCGNVSIPFRFGIGDGCHIGKPWFNLSCNGSSKPAKPYWGSLEVLNISLQGQLRFSSPVAEDCYNRSGWRESNNSSVSIRLYEDGPFTLSSTSTIFVAIGCDTEAFIKPFNSSNDTTGCLLICEGKGKVLNNSCSGIGCCQASIPTGVKELRTVVRSFHNHSRVLDFNPCSYAFLIDKHLSSSASRISWLTVDMKDTSQFLQWRLTGKLPTRRAKQHEEMRKLWLARARTAFEMILMIVLDTVAIAEETKEILTLLEETAA